MIVLGQCCLGSSHLRMSISRTIQMQWCAYFGRDFWDGYRSIIPEDDGFEDRALLYDAYHQLNHFNLFGGRYLTTAKSDLNGIKDALDRIECG